MALRCKGCGSEERVKNGFMRGKQRHRCKACGLNFTDTPPRGMPLAMKVTAVLLYLLPERVERWNPRLHRTDERAAYAELIPQGRLFVGKEETHGIERDHSRQRHWLARFRRRTCVVSRAVRMVEASIALFARFGGNAGIADLLAIRA